MLFALDSLLQQRDGVSHKNIVQILSKNEII